MRGEGTGYERGKGKVGEGREGKKGYGKEEKGSRGPTGKGRKVGNEGKEMREELGKGIEKEEMDESVSGSVKNHFRAPAYRGLGFKLSMQFK